MNANEELVIAMALKRDISIIIEKGNPRNDLLGEIGEEFVKTAIITTMWDLGFHTRRKTDLLEPQTFKIIPHYYTNNNTNGGIDFYLVFRGNHNRHCCLIEVKNWASYGSISDSMFIEEIIQRFLRVDKKHKYHWILTMNRRNIDLIKERCTRNHIIILPLEEHLTPEYNDLVIIKDVLTKFIDDFTALINSIPNSSHNNPTIATLDTWNDDKSKTHQIREDIRLGKPYRLIVDANGTTYNYVKKVSSLMKKQELLPDRRTNGWKKHFN